MKTPANPCRRLAALFLALCTLPAGFAAQAQTAAPPALELVVLGSGGPGATGCAGSAYAVLVDGVARVFVDAGPGAFVRLGEAKLALGRADIVLLTHLHVDHAGELPGLFKAHAVSSRGPVEFKIFGPAGRRALNADDADFPATSRFIDLLFGKLGAFGYLKDFSAPLSFNVTDIDAPATAAAVPEVRTVFDEGGLPGLRRIAQGTSLLVFNSVVLDPPGSPPVLYTLHTPPKAIGEVADAVRAGQLLLSHLSPALEAQRDGVKASIAAHYAGVVGFAQAGLRLAP